MSTFFPPPSASLRHRAQLRRALLIVLFLTTSADAGKLRVVTYNIAADTDGFTTPRPGLTTVLLGIGDETSNGIAAQPIDILSLQETTSNITTVAPIVADLNSNYGSGSYAMSTFQGTSTGGTGGGPNALVYHTTTLQLIASVGVGTPSGSGAARQPVRYQFRPLGGVAANDFYVYVSHMKSGTATGDKDRRDVEANLLRANANSLPATARIVYTGDFNLSSSFEDAYISLTASGQGQAFDPINMPGNWSTTAQTFRAILTESAVNLRFRDDFHLITQNVISDSAGLQYIDGSYHTFGINGSTPRGGNVDSPTNTALPGLPNRAAVLTALTTASDHLPVVADYNIVVGIAPTVSISPSTQQSCAGSTLMLTATATGTPAPTYQWRRGTTNLTNTGNITGAFSATLTLSPAAESDTASNYNCVVTNSAGSATSNDAALTIFVSGTGDMNGDGLVDGNDIQLFTAALLTVAQPSAVRCAADMDHNGVINAADVPLFIAALAVP